MSGGFWQRIFGTQPRGDTKASRKTAPLPAGAPRKRVFALVGEGQANSDGESRQKLLLSVEPGDPVELKRDQDNPFDTNAVAVRDVAGKTLGYLPRDDAETLAPLLDRGVAPRAKVHRLSGGVPGFSNYGCEISIAWPGRPPHPHRPMDDAQIKYRRALAKREH